MKIWVIGRGYPTKANRMLGSFEFEQARMLARHGHEVIYPVAGMSLRRWNSFGHFNRIIEGVRVIEWWIPFGRPFLPATIRNRISSYLKKRLYSRIMEQDGVPDIVHVHYPALFPFVIFEDLQKKGAKLICTEHWSKVQNGTLPKDNLENLKCCVNRFDDIICVSEPLVVSIRQLTGTKRHIDIVPNIVSDAFKIKKTDVWDKKQCFRFLGVGRLVKGKCFDLLIKAFVGAFKKDENVKLDIIGGGEEYKYLKRIIQEMHRENQISLLGTMKRQEIPEYYRKCNALVMSSNLETFGVPIIEALASGLPVVTTDAIGFRSLFHKEHGYIVPANDEKALADAMWNLYNNYNNFNREAISDYAKRFFSEDTVYKKLYSIYEREER